MIGRIYKITSPDLPDLCYIGSTARTLQYRWEQHKALYVGWLAGEQNAFAIFPYFKDHGIDKFEMTLIKEYNVVDKHHIRAYEQLWINKYRKTAINKNAACQIIPKKILKRIKERTRKEKDPEFAKKMKAKAKEKYQKNKQNPEFVKKNRERAKAYQEANKEKTKENQKKYREANKEKLDAKVKEYREANKEKLSAKAKEYQEANKEKLSAKAKEYREANKEKLSAKAKEHYQANKEKHKEYYEANKEKRKQRYEANKELHKAYIKAYYQANKEKCLQYAKVTVQCECGSEYQRAGKTNHLRTKKHTQWADSQEA